MATLWIVITAFAWLLAGLICAAYIFSKAKFDNNAQKYVTAGISVLAAPFLAVVFLCVAIAAVLSLLAEYLVALASVFKKTKEDETT